MKSKFLVLFMSIILLLSFASATKVWNFNDYNVTATAFIGDGSHLSGVVPYIGATSNLDLGAYSLRAGNFKFNDINQSILIGTGVGGTLYGVTAVGDGAGNWNSGGSGSFFGRYSGYGNSGSRVTATGYNSAYQNTGLYVTATGKNSAFQNTGTYVTSMGYQSAQYNTGSSSSGFGSHSLYNNSGSNVVAIGYQAGKDNAVSNQFIVQQANVNSVPLIQGDFLSGNVGIGTTSPTAKLDVAGSINIADGSYYKYAGQNAFRLAKGTDTYYANTFVGLGAGNSTATRQTAIGRYAGRLNTGDYQTAIGRYAGRLNTGNYQTAIGSNAGQSNTGSSQTAIGSYAGYSNTGSSQTTIGVGAGQSNTGNYQTVIGYNAGQSNTGGRVTGLGYYATYNNSGSNVVAIGYQAGKDNAVSNQFIVQQTNVNSVPLIQGDFLSGNVGIGTTSPQNTLNVVGDGNFTRSLIVGENLTLSKGGNIYNNGTDVIIDY